jgi:hypothetical protein
VGKGKQTCASTRLSMKGSWSSMMSLSFPNLDRRLSGSQDGRRYLLMIRPRLVVSKK